MADSDSGIKRAGAPEGAEEPAAKRQATEGGAIVKHDDVAAAGRVDGGSKVDGGFRQPVTSEMAAELKRKVKEALSRRKVYLELEFNHLESGKRLLDFAATVREPL